MASRSKTQSLETSGFNTFLSALSFSCANSMQAESRPHGGEPPNLKRKQHCGPFDQYIVHTLSFLLIIGWDIPCVTLANMDSVTYFTTESRSSRRNHQIFKSIIFNASYLHHFYSKCLYPRKLACRWILLHIKIEAKTKTRAAVTFGVLGTIFKN